MLSFINRLAMCEQGEGFMERRLRKVGEKICKMSINKLFNDKSEELSEVLYEYSSKFKSELFVK